MARTRDAAICPISDLSNLPSLTTKSKPASDFPPRDYETMHQASCLKQQMPYSDSRTIRGEAVQAVSISSNLGTHSPSPPPPVKHNAHKPFAVLIAKIGIERTNMWQGTAAICKMLSTCSVQVCFSESKSASHHVGLTCACSQLAQSSN